MPRFRYQAVDANQQSVGGDIEAESARMAIELLEARGLLVQSIGFAERLAVSELQATAFRQPSSPVPTPSGVADGPDLAPLTTRIRELLDRGSEIAPALRAYAGETPHPRRRRELNGLCNVLERGRVDEVNAALAELPEYWLPLLAASATAEDAPTALRRFLSDLGAASELRRQQWAVWAYPAFIAGLTLAVLVLLSIAVVPAFAEIFADFGLELPGLTVAVLKVSEAINRWGMTLAIGAATIVVLLVIWRGALKHADRGAAGSGWSSRATAIAALARATAALVSMGLSAAESLRIAAFSARRRSLRRAAWEFAEYLGGNLTMTRKRARRSLSFALAYALETEMTVDARVELLGQLSQIYVDRANRQWSWTQGLAGPIAIMVLGACVALVVIALFLPLVSLINNLSG